MSKFDINAAVTDRIIAQLEQGIIPWRKPWTMGGKRFVKVGEKTEVITLNGAVNYVSGRRYSLLNQMLLGKEGDWMTFKQAKDHGGHIRKGAKSSIVVFWKMLPITEKADDGTETPKVIPLLKYYNVFHISDVDGIEPKHTGSETVTITTPIYEEVEDEIGLYERCTEADNVLNDYVSRSNLKYEESIGDSAYYSPSSHYVHIPARSQFGDSTAEFYSTVFHELTHSTGHKDLLNRFTGKAATARFGSQDYSKEELVAEIGASSILNYLGIETADSFKNNTAYIQGWLEHLRNDKNMVVSAAGKAEKAVRLILNIKEETEKEAE